MNMASMKNIGAFLLAVGGFPNTLLTANAPATGTDGVKQNGPTIDRFDVDPRYFSAVGVFSITTASLGPATADVTIQWEDSADGTNWAVYQTDTAVQYATDATFQLQSNVNLFGARRYIRACVTAVFSAAATDTANVAGIVVAGGGDVTPMGLRGEEPISA